MPSRWPERFCCDEQLELIGYDGRTAERDLASWRRDGPRAETRELIDVIRREGVEDAIVLDIGAGVGAVHTALLQAGAARAIDVDASREFLATARAEAERRGLTDKVEYHYGDIVELVADVPAADIVTLDSVICCYPYLAPLLKAAVGTRPHLVGITYPRDTWWMRAYMRSYNVVEALRRRPGRYFVHRHRAVVGLMKDAGYQEVHDGGSPAWRVAVYRSLVEVARHA